MFTCGDCHAICEGREKHPEAQACEMFDGAEDVAAPETPDPLLATRQWVESIDVRLYELERRFSTVISAIVRASGPEEER